MISDIWIMCYPRVEDNIGCLMCQSFLLRVLRSAPFRCPLRSSLLVRFFILCWLLGFILELRITVGVFYSSWSVVSLGLIEPRSIVISGEYMQFNLSSTRG